LWETNLIAFSKVVEKLPFGCGESICIVTERAWGHIQFLHRNVTMEHVQSALLECHGDFVTNDCTPHDICLSSHIAEDQLIATEVPVTDFNEPLIFKFRGRGSRKPVRIVPKPYFITTTQILCLCLIKRGNEIELVTAYWKNPRIPELQHTAEYFATYAFVDDVNYGDEINLSLNQYRNL
jgi:hypothetical protein